MVAHLVLFSLFLQISISYGWLLSSKINNLHLSKYKLIKLQVIQRDEKGYEIKPVDWFNGLSMDPGASLTDPRAVPPECRQFAEDIKSGKKEVSLQESVAFIDQHYDYFAVPFTVGDIENKANENTNIAKILSFALMTKMDEDQTLRLFGEVYRNLSPNGNDHLNIRNFKKYGWNRVIFKAGLAIVSKLQAYDDTESALATQATIEGESGWDANSDSWIP
jgi:hypothetical protein